MNKKDLFKNQNPNKFISSANFDKLKEDVESKDFILQKIKNQKLFHPKVDFSDPDNFARYGLAEEYYKATMEHIYKTFPYDGSLYEREKWYNESTYLDRYIYEYKYPRTNGYATLGYTWGTAGSVIQSYNAPLSSANYEYITIKGGPHAAFFPGGGSANSLADIYEVSGRTGFLANVYRSSKNRENNLKFDLAKGVTVEFWLKKDGYDNTLTKREVLFDLWNNSASSSAGFGRLSIELSASNTADEDTFRVTCQSGTVGFFDQGIGALTTASVGNNSWTHYAVSFLSKSSGVGVNFYTNGVLKQENNNLGSVGVGINNVTGVLNATIGSLITTPSGNVYHGQTMTGYGKLYSASLDEFRFWKTSRTSKQIYRDYNNQIGGGTNTDDANTDLGVYYKFNEGITGVTNTDSNVLDYSGRVSNGIWTGYTTNSRNTDSAIVLSSASISEYKDPIIYSFHPDVLRVKNELINSGSIHDNSNNSALFYSYPSWIIDGDEEYGGQNLRYLSQIMASYLDTLYIQIEHLNKLKDVEYTSGSMKPSIFIERALADKGIVNPKMFIDAEIIEQLYNRNEKTNFSKDLVDIKNKIYENIYNNIANIFKSKGTYESFRNVLNSLGISRKIVDINMYASNNEYEILDDRKQIIEQKKVANFFKSDYYGATIHQHSQSATESRSFISGSENLYHTPVTIESVFTIPKDNIDSNYFFIDNNNLTCSLFGIHATGSASEADLTWPSSADDVTLQTYAIRGKSTHKAGYFLLTGSIAGTVITALTSSVIDSLFDDTTWVLSARFKPQNWPLTSRVSGAYDASADMYQIEMKGVSLRADLDENEFLVTGSLTKAVGQSFAKASKRLYLGAHRTNFTGSVYNNGYSFARFSNLNFWYNYISDDDLKSHLRDHKNYGVSKTYQSSVLLDSNYPASRIPNIDTLALRWDFETVTSSDSSGYFIVDDVTSGSAGNSTARYGFLSDITKKYQYLGRGYGFSANKTDVVKSQHINSYKLSDFESVSSNNLVNIVSDADEIFQLDKRPTEYYFSAEKNYYSAINEKIIETFATLKDFNNIIGETANKYRPEYKELKKYRQLFFEKVQNDLDFEKFVEFYKWVDSSISFIIEQLVPMSADFFPTLSNVVESHVLERNKYFHRVPIIKPIHQTLGIIDVDVSMKRSTVPITISGTIENIISTTYTSYTTASYRGVENNTIGIKRTTAKFRKPSSVRNDYDVVMVSDFSAHRLFMDSNEFDASRVTTECFQVSGTIDYALPTRPIVKSNMIRRFSAPGGEESMTKHYLDYPTEQFSVYDSYNYRNAAIRKQALIIRSSASLSNMYSNPRYEMRSGANSIVTGTFYDNAFVSRGIPASVLQNSWITQSYDPSTTTILNYQSDPDSIGFLKTVDYANTALYSASIGATDNTYTANLQSASPSVYNTYISNIISRHYGWNSWRQSRGHDSFINKYFQKNNIFSVADEIKDISFLSNGKRYVTKGIEPTSFTNYVEPVFTAKFKPVKHMLVLNNENNDVIETKSTFAALKAGFANKEIDSKLKRVFNKETLAYNKVRDLYLKSEDPETSPISGWLSVEYAETVWPKEKYHGINTHRTKENYESTSEELKNNLCQYRTIWKGTAANRKRSTTNGNIAYPEIWPYTDAKNSLGEVSLFSENIWPLSDYSVSGSAAIYASASIIYATASFVWFPLGGGTSFSLLLPDISDVNNPDVSSLVECKFIAAPSITSSFNEFFTGSSALEGTRYLINKINRHPTASLFVEVSNVSGTVSGLKSFTLRSKFPGTYGNIFGLTSSAEFDCGVGFGVYYNFTSGVDPIRSKDGELNSSFYAPDEDLNGGARNHHARIYRDFGIFGTSPEAPIDQSDLMGDEPTLSASLYCEPHVSHYYPAASQTFVHVVRSAEETDGTLITPYGGHPWKVQQLSGRAPFFNSYAEFASDIRPLSQDFSVIPEFNFSDHVSYYYDKSAAVLTVANKNLFRIPGAETTTIFGAAAPTSSAQNETSSYNAEFHKKYIFSDFLQRFHSVYQDHKTVGEVGEITLTCKGIKKFRPEQGFYPVARAVQLGTLFSQSIGPNLVGPSLEYEFDEISIIFNNSSSALQSAIQPLFSPGILYNSIKSGIAVDWPIMYSGSLITSGNFDASINSTRVITSNASKRIPFEALVDLDKFPQQTKVLYLAPSWMSTSSPCTATPYFDWNGETNNKLYEKAANNFVAEVSNFFLQNKNYSFFESDIEDNFKTFQSGSTYYMDVSLKQTSKHFMWKDYFDGTVSNLSFFGLTWDYNGRAFGPGFAHDGSPVGTYHADTIGSTICNAPYTPPYFYGEDTARISFTPSSSRKYFLKEILAASTISYFNTDLDAKDETYGFTSPAWINRMRLSSSVNLLETVTKTPLGIDTDWLTPGSTVSGISELLEPAIDTTFGVSEILNVPKNDAWKIQTKFECPVLNFYNQTSEQYMSRGMWGGLGELASGSEGIFFNIKESFTGSVGPNTGSLIDQLGFIKKKDGKRVGEIAKETVLREAIIAIPFLERKNKNQDEACLTTIDSRNFFKIDSDIMKQLLQDNVDTTITRMANKLQQYVIPPNYNFLRYENIDPFVMYVFEFDTTFTQQDLAYIWQGVMPDASFNPVSEEVIIKHKTGENEFFHGKELPTDIRWMVFKVKQRAKKSYFDVINMTNRDEQEYGYNWPYDYCSLVEVAKLDVDIKITPKKDTVDSGMRIGKVLKDE